MSSPAAAGSVVGRTFGDFVVRKAIGAGGFGEVYLAEQVTLNREAVIKVLRSTIRASPQAIQRFLREARLASQLDHPYAAHVYAFGAEPDGMLWIAMELVRGTALNQILELQGPLPIERSVPLLEKICQVVHTAHEQGIIHRDIKPANVMVLSRAGQLLPKLLDLGVAKALIDDEPRRDVLPTSTDEADLVSPATRDAAAVGSPPYMAPEQWVHAASAGAAADIYSLGAMSYELLKGRPPFTAKTLVGMARAHATKSVPTLGDGFPPELDTVIGKAMAKDATSRYPDALALAAAFRAAALPDSEPIAPPRLDPALLRAFVDGAPQPIAEAASVLDSAHSPRQARDAFWQLVRVIGRVLGIYALACRTRVGPGGDGDAAEVVEAIQALKRRGLSDVEWVDLSRAIVRRFVTRRDAYPIPELVAFFFSDAGEPTEPARVLRDLAARRGAADADASSAETEVAAQLAAILPDLERVLAAVMFLTTYPLVVARDDRIERWAGGRRVPRPQLPGQSRLGPDRPALVDQAGVPVVSLWPLLQVVAPTPGAGDELFVFDGPGPRGARLIAPPFGFEHLDEGVWDWLRQHLSPERAAATADRPDERAPYLGLAAFTARDASLFFGREREAEFLANRLKTQALVAVVGPSGAGKSSFVQAGVLPILPDTWQSVVMRPGSQPLATLAARLATLGSACEPTREAIARALQRSDRTIVVVVDQFEELLTLCRDPAERQAFVETLTSAAATTDGPVRVLCTLRDDFLMRVEQLAGLREALAAGLVLLGMPSREDLLRILVEPGRRAGYEFEDPELPREMVEAVADQPGALPLLSFTAAQLWELRDRHFHQLPRKAYQAMGGVGGALAQHAEATFTAMVADEQRHCREAFRHLVTAEGTRAVLSRGELEQVLGGGVVAPVVVDRLIAARLLVASEDEAGADRIEIVHEALIHAWPRLDGWRHEDVESARLRDQLRQAARQWHERGRPRGLLWRDEALAEYRIWRTRYPGALTETEDAFATASGAEEARGRRVRRLVTALGFVALVVAIAILYQANRRAGAERRAAEAASAQAESRLADNYFDQGRRFVLAGDPMRALVYLSEASRLGIAGPAFELLVAQATAPVESLKMVLSGHKGKVWVARYSPDGKTIATGGEDGTVRLWDAASGQQLRLLEGHKKDVFDLVFRPDGRALATAGWDGEAHVWELPSGKPIAVLHHSDLIWSTRFSPDGTLIATASYDKTAKLWRASDGELVATLPARDQVWGVAFSPDGTTLATTAADGGVTLWDIRTHARLHDLVGHTTLVFSAAFAPDGKRLATASWDHTAAIWDVARGSRLATLQGHSAEIDQLAWSPNGDRVATASRDGTARVWSAGGTLQRTLAGHRSYINSIVFSGDGRRILTASSDGTAKLWDASVGALIASFDGHSTAVYRASFDATESHILTSSWDGTARIWTPTRTALVATLSGHDGLVDDAELCGDRVVTAGEDKTARIWNRETGAPNATLVGHTAAVVTVECNFDQTRVLTASKDGTARIWDRHGHAIAGLARSGELVAARFSRDGRIAVAQADGGVAIWSGTGPPVAVLDAAMPLRDVLWSGDGTLLLGRGEHGAIVWEASSGRVLSRPDVGTAVLDTARFGGLRVLLGSDDKHVRVFEPTGLLVRDFVHPAIVLSTRASPDGTRLIAAIEDGRTAVWNLQTGERLGTLERHYGEVEDAAFSPDGAYVVTGATDGTIKVWDAASMRELASYPSNLGSVYQIEVSADGTRILARDDAGGVFVWRLERDTRTTSQLAAVNKCLIPLTLKEGRLTPAVNDPQSCLR